MTNPNKYESESKRPKAHLQIKNNSDKMLFFLLYFYYTIMQGESKTL